MAKEKHIKIKEISQTFDEPKSPLKKRGKNKKLKIIFIATLLIAVIGFGVYLFWPAKTNKGGEPEDTQETLIEDVKSPLDTESPLNGKMTTATRAALRPAGVMIENHPDARPQSGLDKADLVYEMVTEGGITRFLALFTTESPKEMGPVRSARVPFVNFADEYNSLYAHVGGSAEALSLIAKTKDFYDLNQFSLGKYFWRDKSRLAPHNVYTTLEKLQSAAQSKKYDTNGTYDKWRFKDDETAENRGQTQSVNIDFSSASYKATWNYDKESNSYLRLQAGKAHTDKNTKAQILAKTIIVQHVSSSKEGQYTLMKHLGTGKATIYMDGKVIKGTWSKSAQNSRTKFYDESNIEMKFTRGPIWIEIATNGVKEAVK